MKRRRTGRSDKTDGKERNNSKKPVKRFISGRHRDCTMRNMVINVLYEYIHNYNVNTTLQRTRISQLTEQSDSQSVLEEGWRCKRKVGRKEEKGEKSEKEGRRKSRNRRRKGNDSKEEGPTMDV